MKKNDELFSGIINSEQEKPKDMPDDFWNAIVAITKAREQQAKNYPTLEQAHHRINNVDGMHGVYCITIDNSNYAFQKRQLLDILDVYCLALKSVYFSVHKTYAENYTLKPLLMPNFIWERTRKLISTEPELIFHLDDCGEFEGNW